LDLDYLEDSSASVDMNIVMTTSGKVFQKYKDRVKKSTFSGAQLMDMLDLGEKGIEELIIYKIKQSQESFFKQIKSWPLLSDTILLATNNQGKHANSKAFYLLKKESS